MLDLLNRFKKNNDPLDNLKAAQLWWKKIQAGDLATAHAEVAELVNRFISSQPEPNASRLQALLWLDDQIQPAQESLIVQYVQNPRMSKTIESRLWHQVMGLAHHMIVAYLRFIRDPGRAEEGKDVPIKPATGPSIEPFFVESHGANPALPWFASQVPVFSISCSGQKILGDGESDFPVCRGQGGG